MPGTLDGHIEIQVEDNGEGMPEEVRKRVFMPFFSTKEKKGTGMGLAVVSRIVESHEGNTYVESRAWQRDDLPGVASHPGPES